MLPEVRVASVLSGAVEYIERNYQSSDRLAIVVRNRLTGETTQRLASAEKIASNDFQAWLRHKNAQGADIYISQNALRSDARTRSKADVDKIRHVDSGSRQEWRRRNNQDW